MRPEALLTVLLSIALSACSQIFLKLGMTTPALQKIMQTGSLIQKLIGVMTTPWVVAGLFLYGVSAMVWLGVLARVPLSLAYPFMALGIVTSLIAGRVLFHEPLDAMRLSGIFIICIGIVVLGFSSLNISISKT
jgi:multidrug transporter EmrE-like cation transporter